MEMRETVGEALAKCSVRSEQRRALWAEFVTVFEKTGALAATENLADRANEVKSKLETKLVDLEKKL
jgi:hypothetical protein